MNLKLFAKSEQVFPHVIERLNPVNVVPSEVKMNVVPLGPRKGMTSSVHAVPVIELDDVLVTEIDLVLRAELYNLPHDFVCSCDDIIDIDANWCLHRLGLTTSRSSTVPLVS